MATVSTTHPDSVNHVELELASAERFVERASHQRAG